jgi:hypothetical protein
MNQSRATGLALIATGALVFLGTTDQMLPAETFFPGLAACVLGFIVFMKANRAALQESEARKPRRPSSANKGGDSAAEMPGNDERMRSELDRAAAAGAANTAGSPAAEQPGDRDGEGATRVSSPLESQTQSSLVDQLAKLRRLADDGIISEEEFAVAKAKLGA